VSGGGAGAGELQPGDRLLVAWAAARGVVAPSRLPKQKEPQRELKAATVRLSAAEHG